MVPGSSDFTTWPLVSGVAYMRPGLAMVTACGALAEEASSGRPPS
jgi:hypothetical protein